MNANLLTYFIGPPSPPLDNIRVMVIVWRLRGNIIRTAACWVVWHSVHSHISSFYMPSRLGLSHWDPYAVRRGGCLELYYCNMVEWCWWDSSLIWKTIWFPSVLWHCWFGHMTCKNRPRNVEWDVKPLHYYYYYFVGVVGCVWDAAAVPGCGSEDHLTSRRRSNHPVYSVHLSTTDVTVSCRLRRQCRRQPRVRSEPAPRPPRDNDRIPWRQLWTRYSGCRRRTWPSAERLRSRTS